MAFLVDNNLAPKVAELLAEQFSGTCHVVELSFDTSDDSIIWQHAKENSLCILSKDNDFEAKSRLYGCPPKVVQLKCGNRKTSAVMAILRANSTELADFLNDTEDCLMYLG